MFKGRYVYILTPLHDTFYYLFLHLLFYVRCLFVFFFFFSSRRRHTRFDCDWSSDVCSSDLTGREASGGESAEVRSILPYFYGDAWRSWRQQSRFDRKPCEPRRAPNAEFFQQRFAVRLDGSHADTKRARNFLVGSAVSDFDQYAALARSESVTSSSRRFLRSALSHGDGNMPGDRRAEKRAALVNSANGAAQLARRGVLAQVPLSSRFDAPENVLLMIVDAEYQKGRARNLRPNSSRGLETRKIRHRKIQDHDIRLERFGERNTLLSSRSLSHHLEVRVR